MFTFSVNNVTSIPSTPASQWWVFVLLLGLFLLFAYAKSFSISWLTLSIRTFFRMQERASIFFESSANSFRSKFLMVLSSVVVFALYIYAVRFNLEAGSNFFNFILILFLVSVYYISKRLIGELTGYIFLEKSTLQIVRESYTNIISYMGIILFPMLVLQIYLPLQFFKFIEIVALIVCIAAFLLFVIKLFLIFFHKKLAFLYIMLYLCTLEILPLFFLIKALGAVI